MQTLELVNRVVLKLLPCLVGLFVLGLLVRFALNIWIGAAGSTMPQGAMQFFTMIFSVVELLNSMLFAGLVVIAIQWSQDRSRTTVHTDGT